MSLSACSDCSTCSPIRFTSHAVYHVNCSLLGRTRQLHELAGFILIVVEVYRTPYVSDHQKSPARALEGRNFNSTDVSSILLHIQVHTDDVLVVKGLACPGPDPWGPAPSAQV